MHTQTPFTCPHDAIAMPEKTVDARHLPGACVQPGSTSLVGATWATTATIDVDVLRVAGA